MRTVSAHEDDDSGGQLHGFSVIDEVDAQLEIANIECTIAVRQILTKQEGNMKELLLYIIRYFKADITTAMETSNSDFKTENTKLAKDIPSRMTLILHQNSRQETPKNFKRIDDKFPSRH